MSRIHWLALVSLVVSISVSLSMPAGAHRELAGALEKLNAALRE